MLNGSLDSFALPDVLRFVASGGVTGRVEIVRDEVGGELALDRGKFVGARLTEDEAPSTIDEALDVAVLLFDGSGGTFEVVEEEWVGGPLSLDADELVKAVERRRKEWAAVVEVLGSLEDPLILANDLPHGTDQITIRADQWRLLTFVDGRRGVQEIARDSASSVYATALALAEMANAGMIARGDAAAWEEPAPAPAKKGKRRRRMRIRPTCCTTSPRRRTRTTPTTSRLQSRLQHRRVAPERFGLCARRRVRNRGSGFADKATSPGGIDGGGAPDLERR
jgi:hypothetical protein